MSPDPPRQFTRRCHSQVDAIPHEGVRPVLDLSCYYWPLGELQTSPRSLRPIGFKTSTRWTARLALRQSLSFIFPVSFTTLSQ